MKKIAFVFLSIMITLTYFIGALFIPALSPDKNLQILFWVVHFLLVSTILVAPFLTRMQLIREDQLFYKVYVWLSYRMMGFYFILLFFLLLKEMILKIAPSTNFLVWDFYFSAGAILISAVLTMIGFLVATKCPQVISVNVPVSKEHAHLDQLKIVQLSDVHVGETIKSDFVEKIVSITNELNPDLIVLTGDVIDGQVSKIAHELLPFKKLKAKYGVFYCPGNHEYYWGVESWLDVFRQLDFKVLLNEAYDLSVNGKALTIGGVHDLASHRISSDYACLPDQAFEKTPEEQYKILLAHQPKTVQLIQKSKVDLVLSGHTHAGQFFPASLLIFLFQPYVKGLHKVKETWLYINQGTGFWGPPNRLGTKSEITLLTLHVSK